MTLNPTTARDAANANLTQLALARSHLFGLLAIAFFDPTIELASRLDSGAYLSELHAYFTDLITSQPDAHTSLDPLRAWHRTTTDRNPDDLLHALKIEYARLFIGPGRALVPPYETFYGPRSRDYAPMLMVSPAAVAVERAYRECGVSLPPDLHEPPDHFATEAEFLYVLCRKESDAWAADDCGAAKKWRRRQLAFLDAHLGRWGCRFCDDVATHSRHPFYRAISRVADAVLRLEGSDAILDVERQASPGETAEAGL